MKVIKPQGGQFSDNYSRCGICRYFDKNNDGFESSNLCQCVMDGRDHWAGDSARDCRNFDRVLAGKQ